MFSKRHSLGYIVKKLKQVRKNRSFLTTTGLSGFKLPVQVKNGHIRRVVDDEVKSLVLEISGTNVATCYIQCPIKPRASLGIKLPFLVMVIKNMKRYFTFEIQILDDKDMHRRFRVSNFQSTTKVKPFCTTMPIGLSEGWNQVQFNLADFTKRAYGSTYLETTRVQLHANVRVRRIYFSDTLYSDDEMPNEFKLFAPMKKKGAEVRTSKEAVPEAAKKVEEKVEAEMPPPPSPAEDDMTIPPMEPEEGGAPPSPVDVPPSEPVESAPEEEAAKEEAPAEPKEPVAEGAEPVAEAVEGEVAPPAEGEEGAPPKEGEEITEGGEVSTEPATTEEAATTEEPVTTTNEEPTETTEPTEAATTEESAAPTEAPTESESEPPPE